jgi:hypothetical protein
MNVHPPDAGAYGAPAVETLSVGEWRRRADDVPRAKRPGDVPADVAFWAALNAIAGLADHATGGNAWPDYSRLEARVKRAARKIQDDVLLAQRLGLLVAKRRRNAPKVYQLSWPRGRTPADVAADLEHARAARPRKAWTGPPASDPGLDPRHPDQIGPPGSAPDRTPGGALDRTPGVRLPPSTSQEEAAAGQTAPRETDAPLPLLSSDDSGENQTTSREDIDRAVAIRERETRESGREVRNWEGWRRHLRGELEDDPDEVRAILTRGAGPRVLPARDADWRRGVLALADAIAPRGEMHVAMRLRDMAADVRDGRAAAPDETPDETLRRVRGEIQEHAA